MPCSARTTLTHYVIFGCRGGVWGWFIVAFRASALIVKILHRNMWRAAFLLLVDSSKPSNIQHIGCIARACCSVAFRNQFALIMACTAAEPL